MRKSVQVTWKFLISQTLLVLCCVFLRQSVRCVGVLGRAQYYIMIPVYLITAILNTRYFSILQGGVNEQQTPLTKPTLYNVMDSKVSNSYIPNLLSSNNKNS